MAFGSRSTIARGTQLNGIYEIDEPLASGGMGEIFRAHTIQTGDRVAIKLIRADLAEDESALALFRREASALYSIHHEAIVRYFVFSIDPILQRPYLAMEFVEGAPLGEILSEGPLPLADVMALKERVASGLHAAHQAGIIHRDIAPDNILVRNRDFSTARIIDFGIARLASASEATVIGSGFAGKFNFVSPEQLGLFNGEVTARSDIYSFGLVLAYACLGQRIDMGGSQVEVIEKRRKLPDLSQVYPEIRPLLARMLQPDPTLRPANMREVAHWRPEAKPAADEATIIRLTQPTAPPNRLQPLASTKAPGGGSSRNAKLAMKMRSPLWGASALALLVAMALGATLFVRRSSAPPNEPLPAPQLSAAPPIEPDPSALEKGAATPGERLSGFIVHFDLGACAFMVPIKIDDASARIDGFGLDAKPFEAFDKVFTRATNIEADVKVRQITRAQCPAADFLAKLGAGGPDSPRLSLRQTSLRSGDVFSGEVASDQPNLELMIVDEDGKTYNVTSQMRTGAADRPFAMRLKKKAAAAQAHSLLLIAVGSAAPLQALKAANGVGADALFRAIAEETAGQPDVRATAVSFQIE